MVSPFAMFPPEGLMFEEENDTYQFKKYVEFAVYNMPQMLDKHSSSRLCNNSKMIVDTTKQRRNSIVIESAGILMNACKTVCFSPHVETKTYKKDAW